MPTRFDPPRKVYLDHSQIPGAGRGIFAKQAIGAGELIERCPVIIVPRTDPSNHDESLLADYYYYFGDELALALGFGSLYNHSYAPNATYKPDTADRAIEFVALRAIRKGEEITTNYNFGVPDDRSWPNVRGIPRYAE